MGLALEGQNECPQALIVLFDMLGGGPKRVHRGEAGFLRRCACLGQFGFDVTEPAGEFVIGAPKGNLWIDI